MSGSLEGGAKGPRSHGLAWRRLWGRGTRREACLTGDEACFAAKKRRRAGCRVPAGNGRRGVCCGVFGG